MAGRDTKTGLEYFKFETDIFLDRKVRRLLHAFSGKGFMIYTFVLTEIYRDKGCFMEWDSNTAFDVSDRLNVKESLVKEVIQYCVNIGLFNKGLYERENVLTSKSIQIRWSDTAKKAKRKINEVSQIREEIDLITENKTKPPEEIQFIPEEIQQSKVKESKVKEKKEDSDKSPTDLIIEKMAVFAGQCIKDRRWVEEVCMNVGLPAREAERDKFRIRLWNFCKHLGTTGTKHPNLREFKKHFVSWLRIKSEIKQPKNATPAEWLA